MAKARTYLVTATLEPTVDWVLWLDSDVVNIPPNLFRDLLLYGNAGIEGSTAPEEWNDVITPNIMWRHSTESHALKGYDLNKYALLYAY